jgi:hypothetical protein
MQNRFVLTLAALVEVSASVATSAGPRVDRRVQPESVCWLPDVEFPVACDDDDDDDLGRSPVPQDAGPKPLRAVHTRA